MPGYRNADKNFRIDSQVEQFNFKLTDDYLSVDFICSDYVFNPIDRVDLYLKDKRVLRNCFIVGGKLIYYYEKSWYYHRNDPRESVPDPPCNICQRFEFTSDDVEAIALNNDLVKPVLDWSYWFQIDWLFGLKPNEYDTRRGIEENIFIKASTYNNNLNLTDKIIC